MIIREYKSEDRNQLENLIAELQDYEGEFVPDMLAGKDMAAKYLDEAILKDQISKEGKVFVAEDQEKLVGFISVYIEKESRDLMYKDPIYTFLYVGDFIVPKSHRGQGVGKALLETAEKYVLDKGIDKLKLNVNAKNHQSRKIYEKMGFTEDEVILVKKLQK